MGSSYQAYLTRHLELLAKYGFVRGEGDTQFWYFLIFVILFLGISLAPLLVVACCSFLWGVVARLAYILGWVFFGFSKVWSDLLSRYGRFIEYRFGWGTVGLAVIVYWFCGGFVGFFYVVSFAVYLPAPARVTLSEGINYIARNPAAAFLAALLFLVGCAVYKAVTYKIKNSK